MKAEKVSDLFVLRYLADEGVFIEWRGGESWVVCTNGRRVLNRYGVWEDEPNPSSRSDEFIARTRYSGPQKALDRWNRSNP